MKIKSITKLALVVSLTVVPFSYDSANAQESSESYSQMQDEKRKNGVMKKVKELDLSEEQKKQLKAIKEKKKARKETKKANRNKIKDLRLQLQAGFKSSKSSSELRSIHKQIKAIHTQLQEERFETLLEIREVLTPEQRATIDFLPFKKLKPKK